MMSFERQFEQIHEAIAVRLPSYLESERAELFEDWGAFIETVHKARVTEEVGPKGEKWPAYSGLTLEIYDKTNRPAKLAGPKLAASLTRGAGGNLYNVNARGVTYGTNLTANGYFVVVTLQSDFYSPKYADAEKGNRIRGYLSHLLGRPFRASPPLPGNANNGRLHHPARQLMGLEEPHARQLGNLVLVWAERMIERALEPISRGAA